MRFTISKRNSTLFVSSQFLSALVFTIPIWIVYYQDKISISQISFLVAFQYAIQLFLELPTGAFADLIGRKKTIVLGYLSLALSSLLLIYSPNFTTILIAAFFAGMSEAFISGALEALVYDSLKQDGKEGEFSSIMAKSSFWFQIALAIGTFGGGILYQLWVGLPFLLHGLTSIAATFLSFFFIEPRIDSERFTLKNYVRQIVEGSKHAFSTRNVVVISLFYVAVAAITWPNQLYFNSFMLVELGFNDGQRSLIGGVQRLINIFILSSLLKNTKIFTRERSILFFPFMMILCFLPGVFFTGWASLPLVTGALMVGTARWIILSKYTNEAFESKYRATAISALSMLVGVIYVIITFISGPIIERFGGVRAIYTILGILTLFTVVPLSIKVLGVKR